MPNVYGEMCTTPPVRISHPALFQAEYYSNPPKAGEVPKYKITPTFSKQDPAAMAFLEQLGDLINKVIVEAWPNPNDRPRIPMVGNEFAMIKDADISVGEKNRIPIIESYPERAGHYYFACTNKDKQELYDATGQPVIQPSIIYAGCWCMIRLQPWSWDNQNGKGISFTQTAVLFHHDDAPFSSRKKEEFSAMFPGAGGQVTGANNPANYNPPAGQAPQQGYTPPAQAATPSGPVHQGFSPAPAEPTGPPTHDQYGRPLAAPANPAPTHDGYGNPVPPGTPHDKIPF